jgi:hypothetical protein
MGIRAKDTTVSRGHEQHEKEQRTDAAISAVPAKGALAYTAYARAVARAGVRASGVNTTASDDRLNVVVARAKAVDTDIPGASGNRAIGSDSRGAGGAHVAVVILIARRQIVVSQIQVAVLA